MGDTLTAEPAPDFDNPIGMLKACHQRILGFCELMEKIVVHADEKGVDKEVEQAAQKVRRYFSLAGLHHTADEEQDLFPLLIESSSQTAAVIQELQRDHVAINALWKQLDAILSRPTLIDETPEFANWVTQFSDTYREHIKTEETELFERAVQILNAGQLEQLGKNMKTRRENAR